GREAVLDLLAVRDVVVRGEGRHRGDEERRAADLAPVLVQGDVLEDLVVVPAVAAPRHVLAVAGDVIREAHAWTDVVGVGRALGGDALRLHGPDGRRVEPVGV